MRTGLRKLATVCAALVALIGVGSGTAKAVAPQVGHGQEIAPLYLEHGATMFSSSSTGTCSDHYSHSSHSSHASHESHYSHYSGR